MRGVCENELGSTNTFEGVVSCGGWLLVVGWGGEKMRNLHNWNKHEDHKSRTDGVESNLIRKGLFISY